MCWSHAGACAGRILKHVQVTCSRRRRVVRLVHLGMPERVLITRPTHVQGEVRCLALPTDRVVYGITIHYPSSADEESRTKHHSRVACTTSQRSRLCNIPAESPMQHLDGVAHATSQRSRPRNISTESRQHQLTATQGKAGRPNGNGTGCPRSGPRAKIRVPPKRPSQKVRATTKPNTTTKVAPHHDPSKCIQNPGVARGNISRYVQGLDKRGGAFDEAFNTSRPSQPVHKASNALAARGTCECPSLRKVARTQQRHPV